MGDVSLIFLNIVSNRETKIVEKANKHMQNTAQRFDDENALMSSCFFNLEDDIMEYERHAARMHLIRNVASFAAIAELNAITATETQVRAVEDVDVLDTVIETQGLLQKTVWIIFRNNELFSCSLDIDFCLYVLHACSRFYFILDLSQKTSRSIPMIQECLLWRS
jgi:hypothetical protein